MIHESALPSGLPELALLFVELALPLIVDPLTRGCVSRAETGAATSEEIALAPSAIEDREASPRVETSSCLSNWVLSPVIAAFWGVEVKTKSSRMLNAGRMRKGVVG
jgi:hypothetical protein